MKGLKFLTDTFSNNSGTGRLVMSILCRNEIDIIESNIRTHANLGVDAFLVMDNLSTDGTREKLEELKSEFDLTVIDQTSTNYEQSKWMGQLVAKSRQLGAQWIISNDADEFWIPQKKGTTIKDLLRVDDSVVTVQRSNMLISESMQHADKFKFSDSCYRVKTPVPYPECVRINDDDVLILLNPTPPKVIVNPYGFLKISGGNHRAKHLRSFLTARQENGLHVYHYPIRSWSHFEECVLNWQKLLRETNAKMGKHCLRWIRLYEEGKLEEEYSRFTVNVDNKNCLMHSGLIEYDSLPSEIIVS